MNKSGMGLYNRWNEVKKDREVRQKVLERPWYQFALSLIKNHVPLNGKTLDIGCGVGEFCEMLRSLDFDVIATDGEPRQAKVVKELGLPMVVSNFEYNLPFKPCTFDFVTTLEVIEHLVRAEYFLEEIYRILKPRGYLVLSTPNFLFYQSRLWYLFGYDLINEGVHIRFFTPQKLKHTLNQAGFKVIESASFSSAIGFNKLRRIFGKDRVYFRVPEAMERFLAYDLVYLAMKPEK